MKENEENIYMSKYIEESKKIIQNSVKNNKLILFVGAGVSVNSGIPTWGGIINKIKNKLDLGNVDEYIKIAQYYYNAIGKKEYYEFLNNEINLNVKPNNIHTKMLELNPDHIITTNYDNLIETAASNKGMFYDIVAKDSDLPYASNKMIIKMHGDFNNKNIVFKEDDYLSYSNNFKLIENYIKSLFATHTIFFIGYSLNDQNVKLIFQWIKDILGEDLTKPYFLKIDDKNEFNINEFEYYKSMGINLLYYSQIPIQARKELENDNGGLKDVKGQKTYKFIRYLLDDYNVKFNIDNLYNYIINYEEINYIDQYTLKKFLKKYVGLIGGIDYNIIDNVIYFYNDKCDYMLKEIRKLAVKDKYKFYKIVEFLDKMEIKKVVKEKKDGYLSKTKIVYKNKKEYKIINNENVYKEFNFKRMSNLINCFEIESEKNDYKSKFEIAYCKYFYGDYYGSYKILKNLSEESLKEKNLYTYFVSEFNRLYVGRLISEGFMYELLISRVVEEEIKQINLDKMMLKLSLNTEELENIQKLVTWSFIKFNEFSNIKQKVDKDENTMYSWIDKKSTGLYEYKKQILGLWKFIKYNYLCIDKCQDVRNVFYTYIDTIFRSYSIPKLTSDRDMLFGDKAENIKIEEIEAMDITYILEYVPYQKLENILKRFEIKKIEIKKDDYSKIISVIKSVFEFYINQNNNTKYYFDLNKICLLLSIINIDLKDYIDFCNYIIEILKANNLNINEYKYLNKFIYSQYEYFDNYDCKSLERILKAVLINIENENNIHNYIITLIRNCTTYIDKKDSSIKLKGDEIIRIINKEYFYKISIFLYRIMDNNGKKMINKYINQRFLKNEYDYKDCELYFYSLMEKVNKPNISYETKYFYYMKKLLMQKENSQEKWTGNSLNTLLNMTSNLMLNEYILDKEQFKMFLGQEDDFDFLFDIEKYNVDNFKIEWLDEYNENLVEIISKNKKIKEKVKNEIENDILNEKKVNIKLLKYYVKFFK